MACPTAPLSAAERAPVVVELFTSQGCSSCPPADSYLGELAQRPDVLALAFHVDYWNYIGWSDPFAAKFASDRQREYAKRLGLRYVYTPQIVVNGTLEGVGSERQTISPMIRQIAAEPGPHFIPNLTRARDGRLLIHIDAATLPEPATVWIVGFDREHTTQVLRGENEGHMLHDFQVVRSCDAIGVWRGPALDIAVPADKVRGDGDVAVLLQLGGQGRIIGAATLRPATS